MPQMSGLSGAELASGADKVVCGCLVWQSGAVGESGFSIYLSGLMSSPLFPTISPSAPPTHTHTHSGVSALHSPSLSHPTVST